MLGRNLSKVWRRQFWPKPTSSLISRSDPNLSNPTVRIRPANGSQYTRQVVTNAYIPPSLIAPKWVDPYVHHQNSSAWQRMGHRTPGLKRGSLVKIISWNVNWSSPDPEARTRAALAHLEHVLDPEDDNVVVMFQEICPSALRVLLENPWVQHKFILSDIIPPATPRAVTLNRFSVLQESSRADAPYFTIMMASRDLPVLGCFRIPLVTAMGRDVLAIDVDTSSSDDKSRQQTCVRLCTTHLESLWRGKSYRLGQLAVIADLLKRPTISGYRVLAGIVGGDMNAIDKSEHNYHQEEQVNLNEIREDRRPEPLLGHESTDNAGGSTWGYQPSQRRGPVRMDKFFYTGAIEPAPVRDSGGAGRKLEFLGVGLRTEVEAWELEREEIESRGRKLQTRQSRELISRERLTALENLGFLKSYTVRQRKVDAWVSDHFGIVARVRI